MQHREPQAGNALMTSILTRLAIAFLIAAAVILVLSTLQRRVIYLPFGRVPPPEAVGLRAAEEVGLRTDDGLTLGAWFVPAEEPSSGHTVIVFNGNGGNRAMRAPLASALAGRHVNTLLFDYRGYGGNPGSPSEEGLARDARAALRYATSRRGVDPDRISYFGESLGTGVAVRLATEHRPAALILRSPYTSLVDVGRYHYPFLPVGLLLRDRFPSRDRIRQVGCPLLVIAAGRDGVVPAHLSRALYDAAHEPKELLMIDGAGHNDPEMFAGRRLVDAVAALLRRAT